MSPALCKISFSKKSLFYCSGQTLIEAVVALGAIAAIATAISVVVITSLDNAEFSDYQSLATKYSQEGMEILRSVRDGNYVAFKAYNGTYCLNSGQTSLSPSNTCTAPNIDNIFIRTVTINQNPGCDATSAQVTVNVAWKDGKCTQNTYCHNSTLVSCFSTVNPVQAP